MRVVVSYPPIIEEIDAAFDVRGKSIAFAWGDTIFNPSGDDLPPEILAHEEVHGRRQLGTAKAGTARGDGAIRQWWHSYISNRTFRLDEEIPAHVAEYMALCSLHRDRWVSQRAMRRTFAGHIARKLSSPLYGGLITFEAARSVMLSQ